MKMSFKDLLSNLETLKKYESVTESDRNVLGCIFDACLRLHDSLEESGLPSSEDQFQNAVKTCIKSLEKCTHMVNELDLFSSNETIEEIETSSIRYLMLPAVLGNLNLALQSKEFSARLEFLEIAEVYFKDFLLRCKNYELSKRKLINKYEDELLEDDSTETPLNKSISDLAAMRENKIQQYKLKKELKERENELKPALERKDADEYIREYYLVILERWMLTAIEELSNIKSEKSVLQGMISRKEFSQPTSLKKSEIKPLKPIIITKNEIQKKVFGLGYPSLPVMTIDDFYRQRFEKMVKEHKNNSEKSLQDMALTGDGLSKEDEAIQKEILLEKDDIETLRKERAWDDWKDDNPRGSGNRKNKG